MGIQIVKVITHTGAGEEYIRNAIHYAANEDSVAFKGYGVAERDPDTAAMQICNTANYFRNEGKNQLIQYMISFTRDVAPNAETAMNITDQAMEPLKGEHMMFIGGHRKQTKQSDYHTHTFAVTTNYETGKMLHATNAINYPIAQRVADITGSKTELIIERKKQLETESDHQNADGIENNNCFRKLFYPKRTE